MVPSSPTGCSSDQCLLLPSAFDLLQTLLRADTRDGKMRPREASLAQDRRGFMGRLAGVFFFGSGVLGIATIPLAGSDLEVVGSAVVSGLAVLIGALVWLLPWDSWPRSASLVLAPLGFALIGAGNYFGGSQVYTYGVFFVVAFVWIGLAHPPWTPLAMAPLATIAYVVPLFHIPGNVAAGVGTAAVTIPVCVLVGESLSLAARRLSRTEEALRQEHDLAVRLRELDQMKTDFFSAVSHELRTPITISRGHLDVLSHELSPEEVGAAVSLVIDELDRMGRVLDDLTTLVRMEDGKSLQLEKVDLSDFVLEVAAKAKPMFDGRLQVPELPGTAFATVDPQRLTQALLNLLHNAAVHSAMATSVELGVREEPGWWRLEVVDDGDGLEPGSENRVFEAFQTGPAATCPGSGLGLAIVRGVAEAHGGSAGVVNRPGYGATFWVRVPRRTPEEIMARAQP
jgi:signal transduction histidine kinase